MAKKVALFFTWREFGAGTTTFTAHLWRGFMLAGINAYIYRVRPKGEHFMRPFAQFDGVEYSNVSPRAALDIARNMPSLLCSPCPAKHLTDPEIIHKLIKAGMRVVIHGLLDYRVHVRLGTAELIRNPFVVRPALTKEFDRATYIPHPYVRAFKVTPPNKLREKHAISIARTTYIKNTHMILAANKLLPSRLRIELRGTIDRMYVRHKLVGVELPNKEHPTKGFKPQWDAGAVECSKSLFAVDMSDGTSNGGGGTQYTFLEAWDGGAVNIINHDWLRDPGVMTNDVNCIAVSNGEELAYAIENTNRTQVKRIVENGEEMLRTHEAKVVAERYWRGLTR